MKERPILFAGPMVRAILDGRKTQTRRIVKGFALELLTDGFTPEYEYVVDPENALCPYGVVGDRLWVRETWCGYRSHSAADDAATNAVWDKFAAGGYPDIVAASNDLPKESTGPLKYLYAADYDDAERRDLSPWSPSIRMPRAACRILLEITDVRVQRLQEISEDDAAAEGVESVDSRTSEDRDGTDFDHALCGNCGGLRLYTAFSGNGGAMPDTDCRECDTHAQRFRWLWDSINPVVGSWDSNPWVWAITFRRVA